MINLYSRALSRAAAFYSQLGFVETFRTPESGELVHIALKLDGFIPGIATIEAAEEHHSLRAEGEGRWIEIVLWTDDTDSALNALARLCSRPPIIFWRATCVLAGSPNGALKRHVWRTHSCVPRSHSCECKGRV